jgi:hypothetical protein
LFIVDDFFFFITLHRWLLGCLIRCVHKFFDLYLGVYLYMQNMVEEIIWPMLAQESLKALGDFRLLFSRENFFIFLNKGLKYVPFILYIGSRYIDEYIKYFCKHLTKLFRFVQ